MGSRWVYWRGCPYCRCDRLGCIKGNGERLRRKVTWMRSNSFGGIRHEGILDKGLMGNTFPNLKNPKLGLPISVNDRIMSSYQSYTACAMDEDVFPWFQSCILGQCDRSLLASYFARHIWEIIHNGSTCAKS
jgi:hypothetical protein